MRSYGGENRASTPTRNNRAIGRIIAMKLKEDYARTGTKSNILEVTEMLYRLAMETGRIRLRNLYFRL